jgi:hypothetical protein
VPEDAVVRLFAVYADAMRRLAKAEAKLYEANVEGRLRTSGMNERELIEFGTNFGNRVSASWRRRSSWCTGGTASTSGSSTP